MSLVAHDMGIEFARIRAISVTAKSPPKPHGQLRIPAEERIDRNGRCAEGRQGNFQSAKSEGVYEHDGKTTLAKIGLRGGGGCVDRIDVKLMAFPANPVDHAANVIHFDGNPTSQLPAKASSNGTLAGARRTAHYDHFAAHGVYALGI
jgi:hypothetical protein